MDTSLQLVLLARACQRLRHIRSITMDGRIYSDAKFAIADIEAAMESITKENK